MVDAPKQWPAGLSRERTAYPTIEIKKNTVIWVNENLRMPFAFAVGKPSPLAPVLDFAEGTGTGVKLHTRTWRHGRSADLGPIYFSDTEGRIYRDVDVKGGGSVGPQGEPEPWEERPAQQRVEGLMTKDDALHDAQISEEFVKLGIRSHRVMAIVELGELPFASFDPGGYELIGIRQLKLMRELPKDFVPVLQWRAYGTKTRLVDLAESPRETRTREIDDAIALVARETGGAVYDRDTYLSWFASTLGTNIARMHAAGYIHNYLTAHNITLDCQLTDFDSVERYTPDPAGVIPFKAAQDIRKAELSLAALAAGIPGGDMNELVPKLHEEFRQAYFATRGRHEPV